MVFSPLRSGSSGNVSYLEAGCLCLLIDAGLPAKMIVSLLGEIHVSTQQLSGILITHEHTDHIAGAGTLSRRFDLPIYATEGCWEHLCHAIGKIAPHNIRVIEQDQPFYIQDLHILPFSIPHDSATPVGFAFQHDNHKIALMTDFGHASQHMLDAVAGADLLLLEANHDTEMLRAGNYPFSLKMRILSAHGHLSNEDAGLILVHLYQKGLRHAILGHLSRENNSPEIALTTVQSILAEAGVHDMHVDVALHDQLCGIFHLSR